ncbi:hypothetical protein [Mesorhizobium sp. M1A.F.Ca.IN.022.06.1.1]|uniref:hypothetical protein n=1 Tax=Mesorhizobium sp. M1A.F.Ca.IN.022.06.1.1 TaxID=2493680 RepID=UPI001ABF978A|nr:hypothetical protein [Mesorhizobium sp. M1A.F.Ca.IN.022.06.1.1]
MLIYSNLSGGISFDEHDEELSEADLKPYLRRMAMMFQDPVGSRSPEADGAIALTEPFRIHGLSVAMLKAKRSACFGWSACRRTLLAAIPISFLEVRSGALVYACSCDEPGLDHCR